MNQIIKISPLSIGGEEVNSVNARELHEALGVKKDFSNWIKPKLKDTMLDEGKDYITHTQKGVGGKFDSIDYILTLDTAKHIAMMSRTAKGKEVRAYFIEVEKRALGQSGMAKRVEMAPEVLGKMADSMEKIADAFVCMAQGMERLEHRIERLEQKKEPTLPKVRSIEQIAHEATQRQNDVVTNRTSFLLQLFSKLVEINPGINQSQLMALAGYRKDDKRTRHLLQEMDGVLWTTIRNANRILYYPTALEE